MASCWITADLCRCQPEETTASSNNLFRTPVSRGWSADRRAGSRVVGPGGAITGGLAFLPSAFFACGRGRATAAITLNALQPWLLLWSILSCMQQRHQQGRCKDGSFIFDGFSAAALTCRCTALRRRSRCCPGCICAGAILGRKASCRPPTRPCTDLAAYARAVTFALT